MSTRGQGQLPQNFPLREIQEELDRLEVERERLTKKRDQLHTRIVQASDDSGHALAMVLKKLKQVEQRIEQFNGILRTKGLGR